MPQEHLQWIRTQHSGRLGMKLTTKLLLRNTGQWTSTSWQLVSTAAIEDMEYEYRENVAHEVRPDTSPYRRHRSRAATDIIDQVRAAEGAA